MAHLRTDPRPPASGDWVSAVSERPASSHSYGAPALEVAAASCRCAGRGGRSRSPSDQTTPTQCVFVAPGGRAVFGVPRNEVDSDTEERHGSCTSRSRLHRCGSGRTSAGKWRTHPRSRKHRRPYRGVSVSVFDPYLQIIMKAERISLLARTKKADQDDPVRLWLPSWLRCLLHVSADHTRTTHSPSLAPPLGAPEVLVRSEDRP